MAGPVTSSHRIHKRVLSDQQKRRELALQRQSHNRRDSQLQARRLASALLSSSPEEDDQQQPPLDDVVNDARINDGDAYLTVEEEEATSSGSSKAVDKIEAHEATKLKGASARHWFSRQFMLPEWMVDIPPHLKQEWYVLPRPAGKRCLVVSSHGTTISRLRNGRVLHCFPSALPNGARIKSVACPSHMFCILDCIFHEPNQSYYIIDIICWRGYPLYDCSAEFRFFWLNSKIAETGACEAPSIYHRYQFHVVPIYECDPAGLQAAYSGSLPYVRDGLLFSNRHAHYELGLSPLSLVWKDENCSQYVLDTDKMGVVPTHQHIVLELKEDGTVGTIDDPPVILASMPPQFVEQGTPHSSRSGGKQRKSARMSKQKKKQLSFVELMNAPKIVDVEAMEESPEHQIWGQTKKKLEVVPHTSTDSLVVVPPASMGDPAQAIVVPHTSFDTSMVVPPTSMRDLAPSVVFPHTSPLPLSFSPIVG